ncbi:Cytochrome P450 monooxygenase [Exophiala dermatitidis]
MGLIQLNEHIFYMVLWSQHHPLSTLSGCLVLSCLFIAVYIRCRPGLRQIPGPFWASITPLDRLITAASGKQFLKHLEYHDKYGRLVRVGPNHVSFSDASLIPVVYGITSRFMKSDFYSLFDVRNKDGQSIPTVFSVRDARHHKALKRPVANAYSMSTLVELEPMTDDCIDIFQTKLDSKQGKDIDFGEWLQWYAFDVITSVTFSNRIGFMEQEMDVQGIINAIEGRLAYNSVVGEAPVLHKYLLGNPVGSYLAS